MNWVMRESGFVLALSWRILAVIISLISLLGTVDGYSGERAPLMESKFVDQHTPEELVSELSKGQYEVSAKYLLFKYYMDHANYNMALRAAIKMVELSPKEGKAHAALGYIYFQLDRFEEALPEFKKAYQMNHVDSVIPLVVIMYMRSGDFMAEAAPYIPALEKLRLSNIDAYQPLMMYGMKLDAVSRRKFSERIFNGVNFGDLIDNEKVEEWLLLFFKSLGDINSVSGIEKAKTDKAMKTKEPARSTTSNDKSTGTGH